MFAGGVQVEDALLFDLKALLRYGVGGDTLGHGLPLERFYQTLVLHI